MGHRGETQSFLPLLPLIIYARRFWKAVMMFIHHITWLTPPILPQLVHCYLDTAGHLHRPNPDASSKFPRPVLPSAAIWFSAIRGIYRDSTILKREGKFTIKWSPNLLGHVCFWGGNELEFIRHAERLLWWSVDDVGRGEVRVRGIKPLPIENEKMTSYEKEKILGSVREKERVKESRGKREWQKEKRRAEYTNTKKRQIKKRAETNK